MSSPKAYPKRPRSAKCVLIPRAIIPKYPSLVASSTHTFRKTIGRLQIILNSRRIPPRDRMFLRFARAAMTPPRPLKRKRDGDDDGRMLSPKRRRSK